MLVTNAKKEIKKKKSERKMFYIRNLKREFNAH